MTQEEKKLLLKDLCGRLPYGVKISVNDNIESLQGISALDNVVEYGSFLSSDIDEVKPYLFPLSSMTDEQKLHAMFHGIDIDNIKNYDKIRLSTEGFDWLNANHFDYRGLIPMGLANDATGLNIY